MCDYYIILAPFPWKRIIWVITEVEAQCLKLSYLKDREMS
jgi:hypothetical protein